MDRAHVSGYREGLEEGLDSLDRWIDELTHEQDYTTDISVDLLAGFKRVIERVRFRLPIVEQEFAEASLDAVQPVIRLGHILNFWHQIIFTVGETARARTPAALADSLRVIARRHVPGDVVLLFRPGHRGLEYTFSPFGKQVARLIDATATVIDEPLAEVFGLDPTRIVLLSYPAAEQNNVLLHSIFLHEIGHFITDEHNVPRKAYERLVAESGALPPEFEGQDQESVEAVQKVLRRWLWELAADITAIRIVGPAYLFGIYRSMLVGEQLDQYSMAHPPAWLRIRTMLELLREAGFFGVLPPIVAASLEAWEPGLQAAERDFREHLTVARVVEVGGAGKDRIIFELTEQLLPSLQAQVASLLGKHVYTTDLYRQECPILTQQLHHFIPLNEWFEEKERRWHTTTLAGILNAGWNFVIGELEEMYASVGASTESERREFRSRLFALIAKSIELAQIQNDVDGIENPVAP